MKLARRVQRAAASATFAMKAEADRLRAQGKALVDLGLGEPDCDTPAHIQDAAVAAMRKGQTHYTSVEGIPKLRQAIAERYRARHGAPYGADQVLVSCGGKGALFAVIQALVDEGDDVAVFTPYWTSYPEQVKLAGGTPVFAAAREEDGFVPTAEALERALTARTRAVIVNSPCNPTGAVIPAETWRAIAELASARDLFVISDEVYEPFVYDGERFVSGADYHAAIGERLIVVNSLSKPYAMTGWRIGFAVGPRDVLRAAATVQAHDASQAPTISQHAALEALTGTQQPLEAMVAEYAARRTWLVPALRELPGITCVRPRGAFYVFPNVTDLCRSRGIPSSDDLAMTLVREAGVVTVAGEGFGAPGYLRLSYAASLPALRDGVARIAALAAGPSA